MTTENALEEGTALALDFSKLEQVATVGGVLPCAVQNVDTNEVILVAYVNELALRTSVEEGIAVFWSTSRNEALAQGRDLRRDFRVTRGARELRAELAGLSRAPGARRYLPHQERGGRATQLLLPLPRPQYLRAAQP